MISRMLAALLVAALPAACAAPGASPAPDVAVPAGCTVSGVRWSEPAFASRLTRVTVFGESTTVSPTGRTVLDEPFTSSITRLTAPDDWATALATSLSAASGRTVSSGPAVTEDGGYSLPGGSQDDPTIPEMLFYQGVQTVTADFGVDCGATPVSGTFAAWTDLTVGGVTCGGVEEPAEELGRQARRHCPRTPAPGRSAAVPDAVPFDSSDVLVHGADGGASPPKLAAACRPAAWFSAT
ncbi:hypothetical protein AB0F72_32365 [Actinoplanes sp. NPDC023936]|uniref:hypothetical protein n=1 Tax=Actinoplanes sp. NPDC023936 TaxID=3154910 RepID=UPI0033E811B5